MQCLSDTDAVVDLPPSPLSVDPAIIVTPNKDLKKGAQQSASQARKRPLGNPLFAVDDAAQQ